MKEWNVHSSQADVNARHSILWHLLLSSTILLIHCNSIIISYEPLHRLPNVLEQTVKPSCDTLEWNNGDVISRVRNREHFSPRRVNRPKGKKPCVSMGDVPTNERRQNPGSRTRFRDIIVPRNYPRAERERQIRSLIVKGKYAGNNCSLVTRLHCAPVT